MPNRYTFKIFATILGLGLILFACGKKPVLKDSDTIPYKTGNKAPFAVGTQNSVTQPVKEVPVSKAHDFKESGLPSTHLEHPTTGYVVSVEGPAIYLDLTAKNGMTVGSQFRVYREGKELKHPITGQILGTVEEDIGLIQVTKLLENYSVAELVSLEAGKSILPADRVKLITQTHNLTVSPESIPLTGPTDKTLEPSRVMDLSVHRGNINENSRGPGSRGGFETSPYIGVLPTTQQLSENLTEAPAVEKLVNGKAKEFSRSEELPFEIRGVEVGDVDGDGNQEIIVASVHDLLIYRFLKEENGQVFLENLQRIEGTGFETLLSLGVADINRNGRDEIFVTSFEKNRLNSFVLEYQAGSFRRIAENLPLFLRVLKDPGQPPQLLAQPLGIDTPYFGKVLVYAWQDSRYQKIHQFPLPEKVNVYGFIPLKLSSDNPPAILALDDQDHLKLFQQNTVQWKSRSAYGGSTLTFPLQIKIKGFIPVSRALAAGDNYHEEVVVKEKILARDLDHDGVPEVLVRKNNLPGSLVGVFPTVAHNKGEMVLLKWNGVSLEEAWKSPSFEGYIADYQVWDSYQHSKTLLMVGLNLEKGAFFTRRSALLLFFEL